MTTTTSAAISITATITTATTATIATIATTSTTANEDGYDDDSGYAYGDYYKNGYAYYEGLKVDRVAGNGRRTFHSNRWTLAMSIVTYAKPGGVGPTGDE